MRNVNTDFLLHPKMIEMLLLPHLQLIAMVIFILKIQDLTQQPQQCPKANFQNHISLFLEQRLVLNEKGLQTTKWPLISHPHINTIHFMCSIKQNQTLL